MPSNAKRQIKVSNNRDKRLTRKSETVPRRSPIRVGLSMTLEILFSFYVAFDVTVNPITIILLVP